MNRITSLDLPSSFENYVNVDGLTLRNLQPLSHINIFVGANNSGKSRFMRLLAMQETFVGQCSQIDLAVVNTEILKSLSEIKAVMGNYGLTEANQVRIDKIIELSKLPKAVNFSTDVYQEWRNTITDWANIGGINRTASSGAGDSTHGADYTQLAIAICNASKNALQALEDVPQSPTSAKLQKVYIPTLRGLRPLDEAHTDFYAKRTLEDYFSNNFETSAPEIFTGLSFYDKLMGLLLGSHVERKIIAKYQDFISQTLYEGRTVTLIPSLKNKVVTVKIGKEEEQPIYMLGDGVQASIILSFLPYILADKPTFFFIEEPEFHLHPGLQRKIFEFFATQKQHTFFFTTHSNHLLDITLDLEECTIFNFSKQIEHDHKDDEQTPFVVVENVDSGHTSSLQQLGVRNSSVFLVNATVWVEGVTDRWYLRAMLASYMRHLIQKGNSRIKIEEDTHYSFVEYSGSNINHWSFLNREEHPIEVERLCSRAIVVMDEDGQKKISRKEELKDILGDRLILLPCREIENLLDYSILLAVVAEYEKIPESNFQDFTYEKYKGEPIGRFIENKMLKNEFNRQGGYAEQSGTLKSKVDFCKKAEPKIHYENLPLSTQEVIQKIYNFICDHN